ncbi:hypothetical protein B0H14DRAFT_3786593 [Mycena olivaceomarginata]|nr:hypothetical protein B0H14DRAFT_3786593 [Mycena olivaceomarginata]
MISASARRPALPLSQARGAHILAGAQFRSASHSASPTDLPCHARNQASVATPRESWGSGSTDTPVPAVERAPAVRRRWGRRKRRFLGAAAARWMVGEGKRRDKYVAVWPIFAASINDSRAHSRHTAHCGEVCRTFQVCRTAASGTSSLPTGSEKQRSIYTAVALHRLALAICRRPRAATDSRLRRLALTPTLSACSLRSMPASHLSLLPSLPVPLFFLDSLGSVLSMDPSHLPRSSPPPPTALFCSSYSSSLGSSLLPLNARPCRLSSRAARADSGGLVQQTRWVMIALGKVLRTAQARRLGSQCTRRAGLYF